MNAIESSGIVSVSSQQDSGLALICRLDHDTTTGTDGCFFFSLQSWDETMKHQTLTSLVGKKVTITISISE